ncbi:MAG: 4-hydroxybenzoate octaprenyltransferase [bacterium]|nr:MAG: 4-hydroxybenzoate octaprenyltransferase [bacterium]
MKKVNDLLKMIKFSHTVFAFPFAIVSFLMNLEQMPSWDKILLMGLALVLARSGAMTFNRLVDYKYDKENPRTKTRELVTGRLNRKEVILFLLITSSGFIGVSYAINFLCFVLSPFLLIVLFSYSYWKRFSSLSHLYLGFVIGLAPVAVDVALNGSVSILSGLLFLAVTFWIFGFDIIYSLLDIDFDHKANLHSLPARLGPKKALLLSRMAYGLMILSLLTLGYLEQLGFIYYIGVLGVSILLVTQHIWVKHNDYSRVNPAFFTLNSLISMLYLGIVLLDRFLPIY